MKYMLSNYNNGEFWNSEGLRITIQRISFVIEEV